MGIKSIVLENHRDIAVFRRYVVNVSVADIDFAVGYFFKSRYHTKGGGFTAAGRTNQNYELFVLNFKIEIVDRYDVLVVHLFDFF